MGSPELVMTFNGWTISLLLLLGYDISMFISYIVDKYNIKNIISHVRMKEIVDLEILYHNKSLEKIEKIKEGDWIDLRAAENIEIKKGDFGLIDLGVSVKIPEGYEMHIVPRSSTFKKWQILQTNSMGVVDQTYSGNEDILKFPALAMEDTKINVNDRICQFRLIQNQPKINFKEVQSLSSTSRGGFGSTGSN
jgi:dUTP pyrophosphatase